MTTIEYRGITYYMESESNEYKLCITIHLKGLDSFSLIEGDVYKNYENAGNFVYTENNDCFNRVMADCLITDKSIITSFVDQTIDEIKQYLNSDEHISSMEQYNENNEGN